jgi:hypothetical protein
MWPVLPPLQPNHPESDRLLGPVNAYSIDAPIKNYVNRAWFMVIVVRSS